LINTSSLPRQSKPLSSMQVRPIACGRLRSTVSAGSQTIVCRPAARLGG
jgi:hypothetical protein